MFLSGVIYEFLTESFFLDLFLHGKIFNYSAIHDKKFFILLKKDILKTLQNK